MDEITYKAVDRLNSKEVLVAFSDGIVAVFPVTELAARRDAFVVEVEKKGAGLEV